MKDSYERLGDILEIKYGKDYKHLDKGNIPLYGSGGIMSYVNKSIYEKESILIPRKGSLGNLFYMDVPFWTVDTLFWTRIDTSKVNARFLFYLLKTMDLSNFDEGAAVPSLTVNTLSRIKINLPPLPTQQKIASILSAYDELIENNNKRIALLENMASEIYKEWFVRLRFPNYKDTKITDGIPEGWEQKRLKKFGKVVTGKTPSTKVSEYFGGEIPFIKTPDFSTNSVFVIKTKETLTKEGQLSQKSQTIPKGSICVSCIGTAGEMGITSSESQTNQQINSLILKQNYHLEFLYFAIKRLKPYIELYGSSGATMVNLSKSKFENLKILTPTNELIKSYNNISKSMLQEIELLSKKNNLLQQTRDLLLPRLISGKLAV